MGRATRWMLLLATGLCAVAAAPASAVTGGRPASEPYPWMASLQLGDSHYCGATLVRARWALTAAHCVEDVDDDDLTVVLGRDDLAKRRAGETFGVQRVVEHAAFRTDPAAGHDVALLRLDRASGARTLPLVAPGQEALWAAGQPVRVTGWGTSVFLVGPTADDLMPDDLMPDDLMEVDVKVIPDDDCATSYAAQGFDRATQVCAGEPVVGGKDSCQGDSGGPLLARDGSGAWTQVGVVSQGTGCGFPLFYGIYARIGAPELHDWIATRIGGGGSGGGSGGGGGEPAPQPAQPSAVELRFGKTVRRAKRALVLRVRSTAPVTGVRATLERKGRVVARGRLAELDGARRLRMPTSRRPTGKVQVRLTALDADGRAVERSGAARVRR